MNTATEVFKVTPGEVFVAFVVWMVLCLLAVGATAWVIHHDYGLPADSEATPEAYELPDSEPTPEVQVGAVRHHTAPGRVYGHRVSPIAVALRYPAVELPTVPLPTVDEDATTVVIRRKAGRVSR